MTTPSTTQLAQLMQDLQQRQRGLGEQLQTFEALQQEIAQLQRLAPRAPKARQRLDKLERAMRGDLAPVKQRLDLCVDKLQGSFRELEASLKQTGSADTAPRRTRPMAARQFI
ncbi:hypothetical protein JQK19_20730 [Chromobacterium violaceum]|uniref:hypothetical protein n=1 Tax=Chromobacterium violaceum TaxID=536 RepID=UPI001BED00BB|nr:hypothetical protein [Chromobacterium violaceum]MBT2869659.1 hypothetical protein [Chromobacterium violaceum]